MFSLFACDFLNYSSFAFFGLEKKFINGIGESNVTTVFFSVTKHGRHHFLSFFKLVIVNWSKNYFKCN